MNKSMKEKSGETLIREYSGLGRGEHTSIWGGDSEPNITKKVRDRTIKVKRPRIEVYSAIKVLISVIVLLTVLNVINNNHYKTLGDGDIIVREPLETSFDNIDSIDYYTDELGWIGDDGLVEDGMKEFYKRTGVRPYLYTVSDINGNPRPDTLQVEAWGNIKYNELFESEESMLLIFLDNGKEYGHWVVPGKQTKSVIDFEATKVLQSNIDELYKSELSDEELFSSIYLETANEIMGNQDKNSLIGNILRLSIIITKLLLVIIVFINVRLLWDKSLRHKVYKIIQSR